jgi:hypothetical protein
VRRGDAGWRYLFSTADESNLADNEFDASCRETTRNLGKSPLATLPASEGYDWSNWGSTGQCSLGVAVVVLFVVATVFVAAVLFVFFFVWLFSNEDPAIRRV